MNDQPRHWNSIHWREASRTDATEPSRFARECAAIMPHASAVLELGRGWEQDAAFFARDCLGAGFEVLDAESGSEGFDERLSSYVKVCARSRATPVPLP
ncbi:MAG: hypothetical protein ACRDJW_16105 [Thermomicrobiales bacterium]